MFQYNSNLVIPCIHRVVELASVMCLSRNRAHLFVFLVILEYPTKLSFTYLDIFSKRAQT